VTRQPGPTAYVDETWFSGPGHPGVYLLAAVLVEHGETESIAAEARRAMDGGRFHASTLYSRGHPREIEDMLGVISQQASWSIVVANTPVTEGFELARQVALQRLLRELHGSKVSDVVLDLRGDPREWQDAQAKVCRCRRSTTGTGAHTAASLRTNRSRAECA